MSVCTGGVCVVCGVSYVRVCIYVWFVCTVYGGRVSCDVCLCVVCMLWCTLCVVFVECVVCV